MRDKYKYLSKNVIIFAISSFGTKFLSFFLVPLYTNVLSTAEYGVADIITTTATLMIYIFTINIADSVLRFAIDRSERQSEILAYGIRVMVTGSLVLIFVLSLTYLSGCVPWEASYYVFVFLYYLVTAFYQIITNYLRAVDCVKDVAVAGIISAIFMILGNILFLLIIKTGITGYLISLILGPFAAALYCLRRVRLTFKELIVISCDRETRSNMIKYCVPLIFNNIALWITSFLDKYFVTVICGYAENGIYSVSYKIPTILSVCYQIFTQAWNLSAIKEFDGNDRDGFFGKTYNIYSAVIVIVCSGLIIVNIPIAKVLFAKDFFVAWKYSSILLIFAMFNALTAFLGSIFVAVKKSRVIASTTLIAAVINIVLNALLIPYIGVYGAAISTAVSYAVMWVIRMSISQKYIHMDIHFGKNIFAYLLVILQVILEHLEGHCYPGQIMILVTLLILYREHWRGIYSVISNEIKSVRK